MAKMKIEIFEFRNTIPSGDFFKKLQFFLQKLLWESTFQHISDHFMPKITIGLKKVFVKFLSLGKVP